MWFKTHAWDAVCSKQDVVSWSAPEADIYAKPVGGASGIHNENIYADMQVERVVKLETESTRRGMWRLRHFREWELQLQDCISERSIELRREPSKDNKADMGTKYSEKTKTKKCLNVMAMVFYY